MKSPDAAILLNKRVAVPVLETVTVCATLTVPTLWLAKLKLEEERKACAEFRPVPVSEMRCGEPAALSVIVRAPLRHPVAVGLKLTEILHFPFGLRLGEQVLVWTKSPDAAMLPMETEPLPELEIVIV